MSIIFSRRRQWIKLILCFTAFLAGVAGSLQAPFYPKEAGKKGVSQMQVGMVFASYHFTIFATSPFFGRNCQNIGIKRMIYIGILVMGLCAIAFSLLGFIGNKSIFVSLSYAIRLVEALGHSSFKTATFAMVAKGYPDAITFIYASLQASFGAGLTLGPFAGELLYSIGGFFLPFALTGSLTLLAAIMTYFIIPSNDNLSSVQTIEDVPQKGISDVLRIPDILIQVLSTLGATICIGFLQATLRNHIDQFQLSDTLIGTLTHEH